MLLTSTETSLARPSRNFWPLLVLGIILAADSATALVFHMTWDQSELVFYIAAPLSALLVGIPAWVRFIILPAKVTPGRGALLGLVCSLIAHPVMWTLLLIISLFASGAGSMDLSLLLIIVFYSLLIAGWITTPIGAIAGALLAWLQISLTNSRQQRINRQALANRQREMSGIEPDQESADATKDPSL